MCEEYEDDNITYTDDLDRKASVTRANDVAQAKRNATLLLTKTWETHSQLSMAAN